LKIERDDHLKIVLVFLFYRNSLSIFHNHKHKESNIFEYFFLDGIYNVRNHSRKVVDFLLGYPW